MRTPFSPKRPLSFLSRLDVLRRDHKKRRRGVRRARPALTIETLEDRMLLAAADATGGDLDYTAADGETNDVVLSPGDWFSIQDADDVLQRGKGGCVPSDFLGGIGLDIGTSFGGSVGGIWEVDWDIGFGIGFPMFGYNLPAGVICPNPTGMSAAGDAGDSIQDGLGRMTEGVSSAVAGAQVTQDDVVFYKVNASNGTVDEYVLYQAVVDPALGLSESEDNDTVSHADLVTTSTLVTGELDTTDDVDFFRIQFAPAFVQREFAVVLDNDPDNDDQYANTSITVYDSSGTELGSNVSFSDGHAVGGFTVPVSGVYPVTYYVAVADNGFGDDTDYRFVVVEATGRTGEDQTKTVEETASPNATIPDYDPANPTNELVSSVTVDMGNSFAHPDTVEVTMNITHTYDEDLDVYLEGPTGITVELFTDVGGSGDNFTNTVLSDSAAQAIDDPGPIPPAPTAPFTGTYRPGGGGSLSAFANGPMSGEWKLHVRDDRTGDEGTLVDWKLTFTVSTNESTDMADSLLLGQSATGDVRSDVDNDFFKVQNGAIDPGDLVFAYVDTQDTNDKGMDDNDSYLTVLAADETTVLGEDDNDGPALSTHSFNQITDDLDDMGLDLWGLAGRFSGDLTVEVKDGNDTVDASKLNLIGQKTKIDGGSGRDTIYGPGGDDVELIGGTGADTFVYNNSAAATVTLNGGTGLDVLLVEGTDGNDIISVQMNGTNLLVSVNGVVATYTNFASASIEALEIAAGDGDDVITVDHSHGDIDVAAGISVGGEGSADELTIIEATGRLAVMRQGPDDRSGSVTLGSLEGLGYDGIEMLKFEPFDPITSGTGTDGAGRIVVLDEDPFEFNDTRLNATDLNALEAADFNPNIDPDDDEDWYLFRAPATGTYRFDVFFQSIGTLSNGQPGLPDEGKLPIEVYNATGTLIVAGSDTSGGQQATFSAAADSVYYLRVDGATSGTFNTYDVALDTVDILGPQLVDPDGAGGMAAVHITDDAGTLRDESQYNLFSPQPATDGPTPMVNSLTIHVRDLLTRDLQNRAPEDADVYPALDPNLAAQPGHYLVVGDHNGPVVISNVIVVNDPVSAGQRATGSIILEFSEALPDDRFTLVISDSVKDPAGNSLDGETNALEPQQSPVFPTGDGISGGDFVARFTVDSRPEIGVSAAGSVWVDTNGNFGFDPDNLDFTNRDIVYSYHPAGSTSDDVFAGAFAAEVGVDGFYGTSDDVAHGFDTLALYGNVAGQFRWLLDTDNNGTFDFEHVDPSGINGSPVAGNFDGDLTNGDEVGLFTGTRWYLDDDRDFEVDATGFGTLVSGYPIVGDFDGDGLDDVGAYTDDVFSIDLAVDGLGTYSDADGQVDASFGFGFIGVQERPVAADMDQDGYDDLGLWVPNRPGAVPEETGEWYFLVSGGNRVLNRMRFDVAAGMNVVDFNSVPFGDDIYAQYGDEFAMPVVGSFDPPVSEPYSNDVPPVVNSISPSIGSVIGPGNVDIDITFSKVVYGVDASDLVLSGSAAGGAAVGMPVNQGSTAWRFPVSNLVEGDLHLSMAPDAGDIKDVLGNDLAETIWNYDVVPEIDLLGTSFGLDHDNLLDAGTVVVSFQILNQQIDAAGPFDVAFYLSDDANINPASDTRLQLDAPDPDAYHVAGLAANTSHSGSAILMAPASDPFGTDNDYYIGMVVDVGGDVTEINEANNRNLGKHMDWDDVSYDLIVPEIDLLATSFDVDPDNLFDTGTVVVSFEILNQQIDASGPFDVKFYLSDDANINPASDTWIRLDATDPDAYHVTGLAAGAKHSGSVSLVVPSSDPFSTDNDYFIGMDVDADDDVTETNETNNRNLGQHVDRDDVSYDAPEIDLLGTSFDINPDNLFATSSVAVSFQILNQQIDAAGPFDVKFYLSDDANINPASDTPLQLDASDPDAYHVAGLGAGVTHSGSANLVVPAGYPFGADNDYFIGMVVDANGDVEETNETNNLNLGQDVDRDDVFYASNIPVTLYETGFDDGLPSDWKVIDGRADGKTWTSANPRGRANANLSGTFMIADSDWAGFTDMDESLITPKLDFSSHKDVVLEFTHAFDTARYWYWFGNAMADVDVRVDGGAWQNVARYQSVDTAGLVALDLSEVAGQRDVEIRWHYHDAYWDFYWGIDNVAITGIRTNGSAGAEGEFTNPADPMDVNDDGRSSPMDVLLLVSYLNERGVTDVSSVTANGEGEGEDFADHCYYDVNADLVISPTDVLRLVNHLNSLANASGEGESIDAAADAATGVPIAESPIEALGLTESTASQLTQTFPQSDSNRLAHDTRSLAADQDGPLARPRSTSLWEEAVDEVVGLGAILADDIAENILGAWGSSPAAGELLSVTDIEARLS